jgi:hypothetical protein
MNSFIISPEHSVLKYIGSTIDLSSRAVSCIENTYMWFR